MATEATMAALRDLSRITGQAANMCEAAERADAATHVLMGESDCWHGTFAEMSGGGPDAQTAREHARAAAHRAALAAKYIDTLLEQADRIYKDLDESDREYGMVRTIEYIEGYQQRAGRAAESAAAEIREAKADEFRDDDEPDEEDLMDPMIAKHYKKPADINGHPADSPGGVVGTPTRAGR